MVATLTNNKQNVYEKALASLYDKKKVWNLLHKERQAKQSYRKEESKNSLISSKRIYTIDAIKYYKVIGLDRDCYIPVDSLYYVSATKIAIFLCYYTMNGMQCKKAKLKMDTINNQIFVSTSSYRNKFIPIKLEKLS